MSQVLNAKELVEEINSYFKAFDGIMAKYEIEKIKNKKFVNDAHEIAKDWLIIGCFTGQRVSDLLRMKKSFIQHIQDYDFIVLEQIKTKLEEKYGQVNINLRDGTYTEIEKKEEVK